MDRGLLQSSACVYTWRNLDCREAIGLEYRGQIRDFYRDEKSTQAILLLAVNPNTRASDLPQVCLNRGKRVRRGM